MPMTIPGKAALNNLFRDEDLFSPLELAILRAKTNEEYIVAWNANRNSLTGEDLELFDLEQREEGGSMTSTCDRERLAELRRNRRLAALQRMVPGALGKEEAA